MTLTDSIALSSAMEMKKKWGGEFPSWEEYKKALQSGRVKTHKTIAVKFMMSPLSRGVGGVPISRRVLYNITMWLSFLVIPVVIISWFVSGFTAWWILGSFFAARYLNQFTRNGYCVEMEMSAKENQKIYEDLVGVGAFIFSPE